MKTQIKFILIILLLAVSVPASAQVTSRLRGTEMHKEKFYAGILDFKYSTEDSTLVNFFVQVPYSEVQFFKSGNSFTADYSVNIAILDEDKEKLISEKLWDEKILSENFKETTSHKNFNLSLKSFVLKPDDYFVKITVEDKNSNNAYVVSREIEVREFSNNFDISDIILIASQTKVGADTKIVPNVSGDIFANKTGIPVYYEIYSSQSGKGKIIYSVRDVKDKVVFADTSSIDLNKGKTPVFYTVEDTNLSLGTYTLKIEAKNQDNNESADITGKFSSRWSGIPANVTNLDLAVEQLVYLATNKELEYMEDAPNREEKIKRFTDFWKQKDPNPTDADNEAFDEYYRRIAYANDNFTHYVDGWKTDMGMVYVVLGPPDNVEHHPFDPDSKPYEVWQYYNLTRSFTFLDTTGFGDYRLLNPLEFDYIRGRDY